MLTSRRLSVCILLCIFSSIARSAQDTRPATGPIALTATITGVEGIVQVRESENARWRKAAIGMKLTEGAEFRTGPKSAVRFEIPPGHTITLDRLGEVKLIEAVQNIRSIKTDIGMKYGRVRYDVEAAGLSHDSTIHSPGSALAVRGTQVSLYDQPPFTPQATSLTGRAQFRNARRQMVGFGGKAKATIHSEGASSAETALSNSLIQTPTLQRTEQQIREMSFLLTHGGAVFGNVAISGTPVRNSEIPSLIGGNLDFVLRWGNQRATDLNLFVRTPRDETFGNPPFILSLFPDNPEIGRLLQENFPQKSPSGGGVGLNHIGPQGIEIASFSRRPPAGLYVVGAYNFIFSETPIDTTGLPKVKFRLEAYLNGVRQPLLLNLEEAVAGSEPPRFGLVFTDSIALTELAATAIQITPAGGQIARAPREKSPTRASAPPPQPSRTPMMRKRD
jgi:hypothetical protein